VGRSVCFSGELRCPIAAAAVSPVPGVYGVPERSPENATSAASAQGADMNPPPRMPTLDLIRWHLFSPAAAVRRIP
jgi:hypothetical protein